MHASQGRKARFDRLPALFKAFRGSQALVRNRLDDCERILHPVMKFVQKDALQPVGDFVLRRIDAGLRQEAAEVSILRLKSHFLFTTHARCLLARDH
ncbi:hypothetical protein SIN04_18610 [Methylocella tundrae]|nr:hypothetical protein SIN04_18610 [Methylocella tundrae]